jgi:hypothetical protein
MKMNKKVLKVSGVVLVGALVFGGGFFANQVKTNATTDWKTDATNAANSALGQSGYNEKEKLKSSAPNDINNVVQNKINAEVQAQQADLQNLLDQYYQDKLNGLTDTAEFKSLEAQIVQIKENIKDRYTAEIDQVFASQTATN